MISIESIENEVLQCVGERKNKLYIKTNNNEDGAKKGKIWSKKKRWLDKIDKEMESQQKKKIHGDLFHHQHTDLWFSEYVFTVKMKSKCPAISKETGRQVQNRRINKKNGPKNIILDL